MTKKKVSLLCSFICFLSLLIFYWLSGGQYSSLIGTVYVFLLTLEAVIHTYLRTSHRVVHLAIFLLFLLNLLANYFYPEQHLDAKVSLIVLSAFMIFMGSWAPFLPYNQLIGIRLVTTCRDQGNWQATHQVLSELSLASASLLFILSSHFNLSIVISFSFTLWLGIPIFYSVWFYLKSRS